MKNLIVATGNQGKLAEFRELFAQANLDFTLDSLTSIPNYQEPVEDAPSFIGNALIKAYAAANASGGAALADDSGICVEALNDAPGIYSARYASLQNYSNPELSKDQMNYSALLHAMEGVENRKAYFYCCLVLVRFPNDPAPLIAIGKCYGELLHQAQGTNGHGYDPIFFSYDLQKSFGEASSAEKNQVSHRAIAFKNLVSQI